MSETVLIALISGGIGLVTGAIGSLFAPWANWGVEKRRRRFEYRKELVAHWRLMMKTIINRHQTDRTPLIEILQMETHWYSLKPHLSVVTLGILGIENPNPFIDTSDFAKSARMVQRIEQRYPERAAQGTPWSINILNSLIDEIGEIEKNGG